MAIYGTLIALGLGVAFVPATATVVKWFIRRRGTAAGLVTSGIAAGTMVVPPLAGLLIQHLGWRDAYFWLGIGLGILLIAVASVMVREPELLGLYPDGHSLDPTTDVARLRQANATERRPADEFSWRPGEALRTTAFWLLVAAYALNSAVLFIPLVHLVGFARYEVGVPEGMAAAAISVIGIGSLAGRLITAAVTDRVGDRGVVLLCFFSQVVAFLALVVAGSLPILYLAAVVYGFSYGGLTVMMPVLVGNFFGRGHAGTIGGVFFAALGSCAGLGPVLGGSIADLSGSYRLAFLVAAAFNAAGFLVFLAVRRPDPSRLARYPVTA